MTSANEDPILLPDGKVLVAGGVKGTQPTSVNVADAELFDSSTGTWTATGSMSTDRDVHTLTLLTSGQVLVAGGVSGGWGVCNDLTSAELYDSSAGTWFPTGNMIAARGIPYGDNTSEWTSPRGWGHRLRGQHSIQRGTLHATKRGQPMSATSIRTC